MRLHVGHTAIPFTAQTVDGETVSLEQFAGRPVLLMFYRYASCPMCNLRLHDFLEQYPRLQDTGLEVLAFFHSAPRSIRAHAGRENRPIRLMADPQLHVYRQYGVETSWPRLLLSAARPRFWVSWLRSMYHGYWGGASLRMATMPADILIGPDGRIVVAHYGEDIGDHLPIERLEACLRDLQPPLGTAAKRLWGQAPSKSEPGTGGQTLAAIVAWSLLWASLLIGSSYFLKGIAIGDWVDAILYLGAAAWVGTSVLRPGALRCA